MKNNFFKENKVVIIVYVALTALFLYSAVNICTYLFGTEREIYVKHENNCTVVDDYSCRHYICYNNGKKIVKDRVHLSFIELAEWKKNSGYITFKQLGTYLTHRSAFVYSTIYSIVFIFFSILFIVCVVNKKKQKSKTGNNQISLDV